MRGFRVYGIVLLVSLLVTSLCGCAKEEDESRPEGQSSAASRDEVSAEAHAQGVRFNDMLASWESGKKDEAVKRLAESVKLGFKNFAHIRKDPDLDTLREHPGYKKILAPEKPAPGKK